MTDVPLAGKGRASHSFASSFWTGDPVALREQETANPPPCCVDAFGVIEALLDAIRHIRSLATWHYDPDADPCNPTPNDMAAHVNGLIIQECDEALRKVGDP